MDLKMRGWRGQEVLWIALYCKIQEVKSKATSYLAGLTIYSMGTIE